jgi:histidinol-phosphatase (PHP family)
MIRKDFHMHCRFSTDSEALPEAMCEAAIARGLTEICFTDHQDLGFDDPTWFRFDPAAYFEVLEAVKKAYAGRLKVHIGVEIGLIPDDPVLAREAEALAADYPWDFIIGSTHQIPVRIGERTYLVDPADPADAQRSWYHFATVRDLMSVYYETVLKNLEQFDFFDTLGHLDYMSRYVPKGLPPYRYEDHEAQIDRILLTAIRKGKALEINTGGLYKGTGKTNPEDRIIRRYLVLGGKKLSFGSDAHRPEHVGFGFESLPDCGNLLP